MATKITIEVFPNAEAWLRKNLPNMTADTVACVRPSGRLNVRTLACAYEDVEEGTKKDCTLEDHVRALRQLAELVGVKLFVGGIKNPRELVAPGNWDVEVVDAYWQLVMLGEVIYG